MAIRIHRGNGRSACHSNSWVQIVEFFGLQSVADLALPTWQMLQCRTAECWESLLAPKHFSFESSLESLQREESAGEMLESLHRISIGRRQCMAKLPDTAEWPFHRRAANFTSHFTACGLDGLKHCALFTLHCTLHWTLHWTFHWTPVTRESCIDQPRDRNHRSASWAPTCHSRMNHPEWFYPAFPHFVARLKLTAMTQFLSFWAYLLQHHQTGHQTGSSEID